MNEKLDRDLESTRKLLKQREIDILRPVLDVFQVAVRDADKKCKIDGCLLCVQTEVAKALSEAKSDCEATKITSLRLYGLVEPQGLL